MLIKSLRLLNFRQFKGATSVEFSCDPERNVTIILGDNTFGKTTLLQAFNWCFYGTVMFDDNPDVLLNLEVANDMNNGDTANVSVEICVIHDGTEYIITRTQQYECNKGRIHGAVPPLSDVFCNPKGTCRRPCGRCGRSDPLSRSLPHRRSR